MDCVAEKCRRSCRRQRSSMPDSFRVRVVHQPMRSGAGGRSSVLNSNGETACRSSRSSAMRRSVRSSSETTRRFAVFVGVTTEHPTPPSTTCRSRRPGWRPRTRRRRAPIAGRPTRPCAERPPPPTATPRAPPPEPPAACPAPLPWPERTPLAVGTTEGQWPKRAAYPSAEKHATKRTDQAPNCRSVSQVRFRYSMRRPEMARAITSCWICSVPSKMS